MYKYEKEALRYADEAFESLSTTSILNYMSTMRTFFTVYMSGSDKSLNQLTHMDINKFIEELNIKRKADIFYHLKIYFDYTYKKGFTHNIFKNVIKPKNMFVPKKAISLDKYNKMKKYIMDDSEDIKIRLTLGFFILCGFKRNVVPRIKNSDLLFDEDRYYLKLKEKENSIPLTKDLTNLIHHVKEKTGETDFICKYKSDDDITTEISNITKKILGEPYSPQVLANTFIIKALSIGNQVYEVSELTSISMKAVITYVDKGVDTIDSQIELIDSM